MQKNGKENLELLRHDLESLRFGMKDEPIDIDLLSPLRELNATSSSFRMPLYVERNIAPYSYKATTDETILLFSGGRVSTATALRLRDLHKNITLLHIEESPELSCRCLEIAQSLKLPLVIQTSDFKLDGVYRGMMLAHEAIEYAVENEISPVVYMGYFYLASTQNNDKKDWKYCNEFMSAYNRAVGKYILGADVVGLLPSYSAVEDEIFRFKEKSKFFA